MAEASGEVKETIRVLKPKLTFYVLSYDFNVYRQWCVRHQIRPQGGNVRYLYEIDVVLGANNFVIVKLDDYYRPDKLNMYDYLTRAIYQRAAYVCESPPYQPIVLDGLVMNMAKLKPT